MTNCENWNEMADVFTKFFHGETSIASLERYPGGEGMKIEESAEKYAGKIIASIPGMRLVVFLPIDSGDYYFSPEEVVLWANFEAGTKRIWSPASLVAKMARSVSGALRPIFCVEGVTSQGGFYIGRPEDTVLHPERCNLVNVLFKVMAVSGVHFIMEAMDPLDFFVLGAGWRQMSRLTVYKSHDDRTVEVVPILR